MELPPTRHPALRPPEEGVGKEDPSLGGVHRKYMLGVRRKSVEKKRASTWTTPRLECLHLGSSWGPERPSSLQRGAKPIGRDSVPDGPFRGGPYSLTLQQKLNSTFTVIRCGFSLGKGWGHYQDRRGEVPTPWASAAPPCGGPVGRTQPQEDKGHLSPLCAKRGQRCFRCRKGSPPPRAEFKNL